MKNLKLKKRDVQFAGSVAVYAAISVSMVGCMNFIHSEPGHTNREGRPLKHAGVTGKTGVVASTGPVSATGAALAGIWKCADTLCDPDTVKVISERQDTIETDSSVRDEKTESFCRIHETAQLSARDDVPGEDRNTFEAEITPVSVKPVDSDENTGNCADVYKEPDAKKSVKIVPSTVHGTHEITIDHVKYTRALPTDLKRIQTAHSKSAAPKYNLWGGTWDCVDANHALETLIFAADKKSITYDLNQTFGSDTCPVEMNVPVSTVTAGPQGAANKVSVYMTKTALISVNDTDPCGSDVSAYNDKQPAPQESTQVFTFDGLNAFQFKGRHCLKK